MKKKLFLLLFFSTLLFGEKLPLVFQGNQYISQRELYEALYLHKPYFYQFYLDEPAIYPKTVVLLKQTLKDYYKSKGFFHAKISHLEEQDKILFIIEENEAIYIASLHNDSELEVDALIPFKVGDIFDADKFTQSKEDIKLFYANQNFCNPQTNAKAWIDIELNKAFLLYESKKNGRCRFGRISIESTPTIESDILESLLYFKENDPFSVTKMHQSYQSLYGYEGISKATLDTQVQEGNKVDVKVKVVENEKPIRFESGLGASSDEGFMALLGIKHRNFIRNLQTVSLMTRVTQIKQNVKLTYDTPLLNKNFFGLDVGFENENFIGFKEYRVVSNLYLRQKVLPSTLQESLILDNSKTYDADDETLFPQKYLFVISPRLEWNYDLRDKILEPTKGYFINTEIMGSLKSDISDATYYKYKVGGGYIMPFIYNTLAMKANFGSLNTFEGNIPASYRFFAGGMHSNRAYGYRRLGPTDDDNNPTGSASLLEATAEYRFQIYKEFRGVVFSDTSFLGNYEVPDYDNGYFSAGIGFRYKTPIGPIAIDAGFDTVRPKEHYAFHFRIGESF